MCHRQVGHANPLGLLATADGADVEGAAVQTRQTQQALYQAQDLVWAKLDRHLILRQNCMAASLNNCSRPRLPLDRACR